jgi:hypothetical protein
MARDDWRVRIELEEEPEGLIERLGFGLGSEARELAKELEDERLAVSHDDDTVFVYASTGLQAEQARKVVEAELADAGLTARSVTIEHWLADEDRWDDEPDGPDWEEEVVARGYAPWEVRVPCESREAVDELADRLEQEGRSIVRGRHYVIVGATSREDAEELSQRLHGEVEPGGELVYEVPEGNPFAVFRFRNPF